MRELKSEFLMRFEADLNPTVDVGMGALGLRAIADVAGGSFEGPRLKGTILPSGADWFIINLEQGIINIDVRATLQTDDGANIFAQYKGRIAVAPEKFTEVLDRSNGLPDPDSYYFRTGPTFETGAENYMWMNRIQAVGMGEITDTGVAYDVFEIK